MADVIWTVFLARLELLGMEREIRQRTFTCAFYRQMKLRASFEEAKIWNKIRPIRALNLIGYQYIVSLLVLVVGVGLGLTLNLRNKKLILD